MGIQAIHTDKITKAVKLLCEQANYYLPKDVFDELTNIYLNDKSDLARSIMEDVLDNAYLGAFNRRPICQDTGITVIFMEIGQDVSIIGGDLTEAINDGVAQAYKDGFMRKSIVDDPVYERRNTQTNTPAVIHTNIVRGSSIKISVAPKGGGSENMSRLKMLKPIEGEEGIINFVVESVKEAGSNPCPPIYIGVGIGGSMEYAAILAKKSLLKKITPYSELLELAKVDRKANLELKIFEAVQKLGIGAQGLGGSKTAFGVSVEMYPCHIASLPVAVNINCHAARHADLTITSDSIIEEEVRPEFIVQKTERMNKSVEYKKVVLPFRQEDIESLRAGDSVLLSGNIITGRDAAHKRLISMLNQGESLPIDLMGRVIYYVGPCPARGDEVIGPAGPTTSGRMDAFTPILLDLGLKGMIGKGFRSEAVIESMLKNGAIYFVATGGAGALLSQKIKKAKLLAFEDLGPEAIYELYVEDFPLVVCIDSLGNNMYRMGEKKYREE